ncbi:DUF4832 domain-containing protein [Candidatus Poribacteria bacterium]
MKIQLLMLTLLSLLYVLISIGTASEVVEMQEIYPQTTDNVLLNPGIGLYLAGGSYQPEPDAWFMKIADIAYFRPGWNQIKPEEKGNSFDEYFGPIFDFWVKQMGKRVAFRVMSESMHSRAKYVTPEWVFAKGVPSVKHKGIYEPEQFDPVFWDEKYLEIQRYMILELGEYLDGREGLEYIDIGSIGEWGEMHLGLHIPGRWTPKQLEETGYTEGKYIKAYRYIIDAFAEAFPHTQVFPNVGSYGNINDYAALKGIHFRQDGLTPSGPSSNVGKRFYHPYSKKGIKGNYEYHSSYNSMKKKGWDLKKTIEKGLEDPISYMNTNIFNMRGLETAPEEVKELLTYAGQKVGFRFIITKLRIPKELNLDGKIPGRLMVEHTWKNTGVAPCYESYALIFSLVNDKNETVADQLFFPKKPTTQWLQNEEVTERTLLRIPVNAPLGQYTLKVSMMAPEEPGYNILLDIAGRDSQDRYDLCKVNAVKAEGRQIVAYREDFESGNLWNALSGMEATTDDKSAHKGDYSLLIRGTQQGSWNYASHALDMNILPGSKYKLSGWLMVESIEPEISPYLKIGLADSEGEWLENHSTNHYDLSEPGTWQYMETILETTVETARGHLAVERGAREALITAVLRLDDVKLELLESP